MVCTKCTPIYPLFGGVISHEDLILYLKSHNFYHLSPKDPLFCVKTPPNFHIHVTKNTHFYWKLPHFCYQKTIPFLNNFVTERPLLFKCLIHMNVTLYKACAPGVYLQPLSLPVNVCISHWRFAVLSFSLTLFYGLSCRVNDRAVRAEPLQCKAFRVTYTQLYRAYAWLTQNARLKSLYKCTRSLATGLQKP